MAENFDFGGYATKCGLKCSDGRVIIKDAFKHNDGQKVPLVWQHCHTDPSNILGHAILENRDDGVYAYCRFNESDNAKDAKESVKHGDITELSIYANALKQQGCNVVHGMIREVSLVMAGANPGAKIDNLAFAHGDGLDPVISDEDAIIFTGLMVDTEVVKHISEADGHRILSEEIASLTPEQKNQVADRIKWQHSDNQIDSIFATINAMNHSQRSAIYKSISESLAHEDGLGEAFEHAKYSDDATVQDVFDSLDEIQKKVVYAIIGEAISSGGDIEHSDKEGDTSMKHNLFDETTKGDVQKKHLTREQIEQILLDGKKCGSLKDSVLAHAAEYGIENIEVLFPDARSIRNTPDLIKREDSWVKPFLAAVRKTPFSRIKSMSADLTEDAARAKGYITGNRKKEEVFPVLKRVTTPTTIYKKQKLDRDDIVDITDFDVVVWLRAEMRLMLDEELARAALIGDGREVDDQDHINTQNIRPIYTDDEIYAPKVKIPADKKTADIIDEIVRARKLYKGVGSPDYYTTEETITDMLLLKDLNQRRIYNTVTELASALRVNSLVAVEVMEGQTRVVDGETLKLHGIMVNPRDYTMGADKGGEVSLFDDFDIDYNQYKYLMETRVSGALTLPKSAVVVEQVTEAAAG